MIVLNGYEYENGMYRRIESASPSFVEDGCKQDECEKSSCFDCWISQKTYSEWKPISEASKDKSIY
jgi:hypothetical protein